jgi:AAA domain
MLEFGRRTTLIFAENGSGKTPIIQAIAFCLGFPTKFREDINGKCSAANLVIEHEGNLIEIRRLIGREFHSQVHSAIGKAEFFSESDFSSALFEILGLTPPMLVSTNKQATQPYIATVLPLFYLNQGDGYAAAYKSPAAFITDQFVEMVRFIFGLNPKHSYQVKKDILAEKDALDAAHRKIVAQQKVIVDLSRTVNDSQENKMILSRLSGSLTAQIDGLRETVDAQGSANSALTDLLRAKEFKIREVQAEIDELRSRVDGIDSIRSEIEGEIATLGLNEESRRIFISFQEICSAPNCGLFIGSSESYGKNLLYLKDQLKDLQRNADRAEIRLDSLKSGLEEQKAEHALIVSKLKAPLIGHGVGQLITAVQALTKQLVETENSRGAIEALQAERAKSLSFEEDRTRIQERIERLSSNHNSDLEFNKLRVRLRELAVKWMDILETPNVSRAIDIDLELRFKFGNESLEVFSGSTKIRLVLAIHAALFEEYLSNDTRPFRFIILDTPKQQEIHTSDLAKYLHRLEELCSAKNAQMLLSSTEYRHPTTVDDSEWLPQYPGEKHLMYLGMPDNSVSN